VDGRSLMGVLCQNGSPPASSAWSAPRFRMQAPDWWVTTVRRFGGFSPSPSPWLAALACNAQSSLRLSSLSLHPPQPSINYLTLIFKGSGRPRGLGPMPPRYAPDGLAPRKCRTTDACATSGSAPPPRWLAWPIAAQLRVIRARDFHARSVSIPE
jgi:hypothetical protein